MATDPHSPLTILVVDDNRALLSSFAFALDAAGYHVVTADSGEAAIAAVEACEHVLDVVLADLIMPGMNGVELVQRLTSAQPGLRVLFMSGYPDYALEQRGLRDWQSRFLRKPFSIELLESKIREQLPR